MPRDLAKMRGFQEVETELKVAEEERNGNNRWFSRDRAGKGKGKGKEKWKEKGKEGRDGKKEKWLGLERGRNPLTA